MTADYPRMMFHRTREPVIVKSEEEEAALGREWSRTVFPPGAADPPPSPVPTPPPPPPPPEPEPEEEPAPKPHKKPAPAKKAAAKKRA